MTQPPQARHNADLLHFLDNGPPPDSTENKPLAPASQEQHTRSPLARGRYGPGKRDPWIQLKWAVFVVFGLAVWSFYVVVGRCRSWCLGGLRNTVAALRMELPESHHRPSRLCYRPSPPLPASYPPPPEPADQGPDPSMLAPAFNLATDAVGNAYPDGTHVPTDAHREEAPKKGVRDWREVQRPVPSVDFGPRWCRFCEINKPDRTHHCRHCGTCVLQFDRQCVGWANHKFFMLFNFWTLLYCLYIMIFLIVTEVKSTNTDGQVIGLIAVAAVFGLFTGVMGSSHVELILSARTTVETFRGREQHERENDALQREYGYFWHNMEKRKARKHWKEQWGGSAVDSRWAVGTKRQRWEQEMGKPILGWILPIGRAQGNGIHFDTNPRFGPNGEWLMKKDWPQGVV
ncbi:hypothetical protein IAT38_002326 [Cryptococcus sp. DSM 104549]